MIQITLTDQNFGDEVFKSPVPVMVDFFGTWCPPCKMAAPVIEELAKKYDGKLKVGKFDVDKNPQITKKYGIMSVPTVIFFKDGKEVRREVGFPGKAEYEKLIKEVIGN